MCIDSHMIKGNEVFLVGVAAGVCYWPIPSVRLFDQPCRNFEGVGPHGFFSVLLGKHSKLVFLAWTQSEIPRD